MTAFRDRVNRWVVIWASIAFVLLLAVGGVTIGLVAAISSSHTSTCVNHLLGDRGPVTAADQHAQISLAQEQAKADAIDAKVADLEKRTLAATANSHAQALIYAQFFAALTEQATEKKTLASVVRQSADVFARDQQIRDQHPLGKC